MHAVYAPIPTHQKYILLCCVYMYFVRYRHSVTTECDVSSSYHENSSKISLVPGPSAPDPRSNVHDIFTSVEK